MSIQRMLIHDDECLSCSALAQMVAARAPDIDMVSIHSPRAQMVLRRHFSDGWALRPYLITTDAHGERVLTGAALSWRMARLLGPTGLLKAAQALARRARRERARGGWAAAAATRMRAYVPANPAEAAAFAREPLRLPTAQAGLTFERVVQWYNFNGAFQTASYWKRGESGTLVLEQVHRASPPPDVEGRTPELVDLGGGIDARVYAAPDGDGAALTLIVPLPERRWLTLRAIGVARETAIAAARTCLSQPER